MTSLSSSGKDNVKVAIRCRPISDKEIRDGRKVAVRLNHLTGQVAVVNPKLASGEKERVFTFDTVLGMDSKQVDVYNETARPIVEFVLEGYNGTIFAYGQTGTGKTFTMEGIREVPEKRGIIPNSFAHIFGHIAKCSQGEVKFLVRVSYLELYNEEARDLLSKTPQKNLKVRERTDIGVYVKDLSYFVVKNADEMGKLIAIGNKNRSFAATDMNLHSSRSHVIFTITIERSDLGPDKKHHIRMGKLHLVDLAGSERQSKTHAEGVRLAEAVKINQSLSTLGNVIAALVDGQRSHIPYRNSNLTRLLQDSLGGNSKTVMIANIGPADYNSEETLSTLRYANRAKNIKNKARINEDPKDAMLREFQNEIEELKRMLADDGESENEEEEERSTTLKQHNISRKKSATLSSHAMTAMKEKIEKERADLLASKDLAEGEKQKAELALKKREEELKAAQKQQLEMEKKLTELNAQVIQGGVNMLEQAEEQEKLLESSAKELEKRRKKEASLKQELKKKEAEKLDIEEKYATLQEEAAGKTRILKEVWKEFQHAKEEIADLKSEAQRENEDLLDMIRELTKEVKFQTLIINSNVPPEYLKNLEDHVEWNEETGDWHMPGLAYAGNNVMNRTASSNMMVLEEYDTSQAYFSYGIGPYRVKSLQSIPSTDLIDRPKGAQQSVPPDHSVFEPVGDDSKSLGASPAKYPASRGLVSNLRRFA